MDRQNRDGSLSTEDHELLTGLALEAFDSPEERERAEKLVSSNEQAAQWLRGYRETLGTPRPGHGRGTPGAVA